MAEVLKPPMAKKQTLWNLKYKQGQKSVEAVFVDAKDQATAEAVGRRWCLLRTRENPSQVVKFVSVTPMVVADESILPDAANPDLAKRPWAELQPEERVALMEGVTLDEARQMLKDRSDPKGMKHGWTTVETLPTATKQ